MADVFRLTPLSYIVVLGASISNLAMGMLEPTVALYLLEIDVTYEGIGQIVAARFLVVAIASLPLALFASRIGLTNILFASGISAIAAGAMLFYGDGKDAVYWFYFIAGISQAAGSGPGAAILAENEGTKRVAAFALFSITWMIPPAIGAGISTLWFSQREGETAEVYASIFPLTFIIMVIGGVVFCLLLLMMIRKGPMLREETDRKLPIPTQFRVLFTPVIVIPFLLLTLVQVMGGMGAGATLPFLPPYLRSLDASSEEISLLVMILNLSMGIATQLSAPLAKKFGDLNVYAVTTILSVVSLLGIVFSNDLVLASAFYIARGTFANMNAPIQQSRAIAYIESSVRATGSAWTSTWRWVGWTTFSPISGRMIEELGYNFSFIFTSGIYLIAMLLFVYVVTRFRDAEKLKSEGKFTLPISVQSKVTIGSD